MLLGCIADDFTGATDLGLTLTREGIRVLQVIGVPEPEQDFADADAVVVALKSRTIPAAEAVRQSLASADALLGAGARQLFFKYCSTFDSTDAGNIGPVAEALLARTGSVLTVASPAFPGNGRTVYQGHLFVGDRLLSESPMRDHPLTPMRDSDLVRVLQRQTPLPVGLIPYATVDRGADAIGEALRTAMRSGTRIAIVDALTERHLRDIGAAVADLPLVTGGSGMAIGLPDNYRSAGLLERRVATARWDTSRGRAAVLAGSCSAATRAQVAHAIRSGYPAFRLSPIALAQGGTSAAGALDWARAQPGELPVLVYSTAEPHEVSAAQAELGRERAAELVETTLAQIARGLVADGATRLIVAGGETAGAVVEALDIKAVEIGPEIDPGVPWTRCTDPSNLRLALKSGNFGAPDFFTKAWSALDWAERGQERRTGA